MPQIETKYFGSVPYEAGSVIEFPAGLPGFENEHRFLPIEIESYRPLVFLQSLADRGLCFLTMPVAAVDPQYRLEVTAEDLAVLGLGRQTTPAPGVLCLAVVTVSEDAITANLLAPLVVNLANRRGVQAIRPEPSYSHQHRLEPAEVAACS